MQKIFIIISIVVVGIMNHKPVEALNGVPVDIHGFLSQGYLHSARNNFYGETRQGNFEFNELGMNFTSEHGDRLHLGAQLFARDMFDYGNDEILIDWAYGEYYWTDWLNIKAGMIKVVHGLKNETRDIDAVRTFIFLPRSIYYEAFRELLVSMKGAGISGRLARGIQYTFSGGVTNQPSSDGLFYNQLNSRLTASLFQFSPQISNQNIDIQVENFSRKKTINTAIRWDTPIPGLLASITYSWGQFGIQASMKSQGNPILKTDLSIDELSLAVASVEYSDEKTTVTSEISQARSHVEEFSNTTESLGWYLSITRRFIELIELGVYYSEYYANSDDKSGHKFSKTGFPAYSAFQKDLCVGSRIDLSDNWLLKIEWHVMEGTNELPQSWNINTSKELSEYWRLFAIKVSYSF